MECSCLYYLKHVVKMDVYQTKKRIVLSFSERRKRKYIEIAFGGDAIIRRRLMQEQGITFEESKAYLPADNFVLSEFFDRYVNDVFIDYSAIKSAPMQSKPARRPELPYSYLEKLQQMRYSHSVAYQKTSDLNRELKRHIYIQKLCLNHLLHKEKRYLCERQALLLFGWVYS